MASAIMRSRSGKRERFHKAQGVGNRFVAEFADIDAADRHSEAFGVQAPSAARVAGDGAHIGFDFFLDPIALAFTEAAFQIIDDALEFVHIDAAAVFALALDADFLPLVP